MTETTCPNRCQRPPTLARVMAGRGSAPIARRHFPLLLSRVPARSMRLAVQTGIIAGAASAGGIVGLGARHGVALLPFSIAGHGVVGTQSDAVAAVAGLILHLAWMLVWGTCFTLVAATLRGARLLIAALLFVGVLGAVTMYLLPVVNPLYRFAALTTSQTVLVYLLLAVALVAGMRLARYDGES